VLLNLLSNAVKYNRDNGAVIVDVAAAGPEAVRIAVQDTGHGLSPEQLASLFQPFNRLGQEGGKVEGTGIGLVVTKRLVELMGGTLDVQSSVGAGCIFSIVLKAATQATPELPAPPAGGTTRAPLRVVGRDVETRPLVLHIEDTRANCAWCARSSTCGATCARCPRRTRAWASNWRAPIARNSS